MRVPGVLLLTFLMTAPCAMAQKACTANCTSISLSWPATAEPDLNCATPAVAPCFAGYQVVLTPPVGTGNAVTLTPAETGGPGSTGTTWKAAGQLYTGEWTITIQAIGVGVANGPIMTTTMNYAPACVTPPVTATVAQ